MFDLKAEAVPNPAAGQVLRRWVVAGAFLVVAAGAALTVHAQGHRGGMGMGMGEPGMMMFGGSPHHIDRAIDHMLDGLNATDAQRGQIKQIATAAAADLKTQHEGSRGLRAQALQIYTAPTVDANAAEGLRQQMLAQHDQASRRIQQAMLDVSQVLTPEQRAKLGERMRARMAAMQEHEQRMHGIQQPGQTPR